LRVDGQGMHAACKFRRQRSINHAVPLDSTLPFEGARYDINAEVRFAARPMAGMPFMKM